MKTAAALIDYIENEFYERHDGPCFESIEVDEVYDEETLPEKIMAFGDEIEIPCDGLEAITQDDLDDIDF